MFLYIPSTYPMLPLFASYIPIIYMLYPLFPLLFGTKKKTASFYFFRESALHPFASVEKFRPRKQELSSNILLGSVRKNHQVGKKNKFTKTRKKNVILGASQPTNHGKVGEFSPEKQLDGQSPEMIWVLPGIQT